MLSWRASLLAASQQHHHCAHGQHSRREDEDEHQTQHSGGVTRDGDGRSFQRLGLHEGGPLLPGQRGCAALQEGHIAGNSLVDGLVVHVAAVDPDDLCAGAVIGSIAIQEKNSGTYTLLNSDGFPITKKEFAIEEAEAHGMYGITTEIAKTCRLIPPDDQIYNHIKLKLGIDGEKSSNTFNIFIGRPYNFWIYEDLTEYYKDKYPDGKVKEIVRLLKSKPNNPTKQ